MKFIEWLFSLFRRPKPLTHKPIQETMDLDIFNKPNTNFKARKVPVHGIIIHSMSEELTGQHASDFLQRLGISAHFLIQPDGAIIECVNPDFQAFHAGASEWLGERWLNNSYIGIEVLVEGEHDYASFLEAIKDPSSFQPYQYENTARLCAVLMDKYPEITQERIVRHSEVSTIDVRPDPKKDPGEGFDMKYLFDLIDQFHGQ